MSKSVVDSGEIVCGFAVRKTYEGQKDFDTDYKEVTIKKRLKKVGQGEDDYIEEEYEDVKLIPIRDVIDAQVDQVGIDAFLRPYKLSGINPPEAVVSDDVNDFSNLPEDPADVAKIGDDMMKRFMSLDPELRGSAKTPDEFFASFSQEKFDAYIASKQKKTEKGKEENEK